MGGYDDAPRQQQQQQQQQLKCNRALPCDQCLKRSIDAGCQYEPYEVYPAYLAGGEVQLRPDVHPLRKRRQPSAGEQLELRDEVHSAPQHVQSEYAPETGPPVFHQRQPSNESFQSQQPQPQSQPQHPADKPHFSQDFTPHPPTRESHDERGQQQSVPERLKYLEELVHFLRVRRVDNNDGDGDGGDDNDSNNAPAAGVPEISVTDFRYTDPAQWEGVLDDIVKVTRDLTLVDDAHVFSPHTRWDFGLQPDTSTATGLAIFQTPLSSLATDTNSPPTAADLLRFLPPRPVVDLSVRRFFDVAAQADPAALHVMFHPPTFYQQYDVLWDDARSASLSHLGLLFGILGHAALSCARTGDPVPGGLAPDPWTVMDGCRQRAAQCLALDDCARPGRHKIEAMVLYFGLEYHGRRHAAAPSPASLTPAVMVLSLAVRLAMHMGYHLDPSHYGGRLSALEGEMRRRTWAVLCALDRTVCDELGLPTNVHHATLSSSSPATSGVFDVQMPRNLHDSDLAHGMATLPPSRPEMECTAMLYTIARARMQAVLTDIVQLQPPRGVAPTMSTATPDTNLLAPPFLSFAPPLLPTPPLGTPESAHVDYSDYSDYNDNTNANTSSMAAYGARIQNLDRRLTMAYDALPACLYLHADDPLGDPRDPADLCMERYLVEILYQKARLVLHRRLQGVARPSPRYAYSRWVCTDAAVRLLRHQYDLYMAMQPLEDGAENRAEEGGGGAGRLHAHRWLLADSSTTLDFLLAATVLCLEVSYMTRRPAAVGDHGAVASLPQLLGLLRTSRSIWATLQGTSPEARRAYSVLTRVLDDAGAVEEADKEVKVDNDNDNEIKIETKTEIDGHATDSIMTEAVSPAATPSMARTDWTRLSGGGTSMSGLAATPPVAVAAVAVAAPPTAYTTTAAATATEATGATSGATSGSTTPRYGAYRTDALDYTDTLPGIISARPPPQSAAMLPSLAPQPITSPWAGPPPGELLSPPVAGSSALPALLDMDMDMAAVGTVVNTAAGYGLRGQPPLHLQPSLQNVQAMATPVGFTSSGLRSGLLPNRSDNSDRGDNGDNDAMQGLVDGYAGDWNAWQDQRRNDPPRDWNGFSPRGTMDNP
ncbi:hypothetical protein SCUCBS95973_007419 [Sporothrix curviconia]|uniref:Xylanolytic transcriptional activator regulatory domain-containing protein n=1 Tax=Sporothrix curviconia TaxID=1260050 RepID=A0ABP0CDT6_9PEZI